MLPHVLFLKALLFWSQTFALSNLASRYGAGFTRLIRCQSFGRKPHTRSRGARWRVRRRAVTPMPPPSSSSLLSSSSSINSITVIYKIAVTIINLDNIWNISGIFLWLFINYKYQQLITKKQTNNRSIVPLAVPLSPSSSSLPCQSIPSPTLKVLSH